PQQVQKGAVLQGGDVVPPRGSLGLEREHRPEAAFGARIVLEVGASPPFLEERLERDWPCARVESEIQEQRDGLVEQLLLQGFIPGNQPRARGDRFRELEPRVEQRLLDGLAV